NLALVAALKADVGQSRMYLGDFFREGRKDRVAAEAEYGRALELFAAQLKDNPGGLDLQQRVAATYFRLGLTAATREKARGAQQESLKIREELAKIDPQDQRCSVELAESLGQLGEARRVANLARRMRTSGTNDRGLRLAMVGALGYAAENAGDAA